MQSNFNKKTYFFAGDGFFATGLLVPELELGLLFVGLLFGGEGNFLDPGEDLAEPALLDVGLPGLLLSAPVAPIFLSFPHDDEGDTLIKKIRHAFESCLSLTQFFQGAQAEGPR